MSRYRVLISGSDAFDGVTRVLQVLRVAGCGLVSLSLERREDRAECDVVADVPDDKVLLVARRMEAVIGILSVDVPGTAGEPPA